MMFMGVPFIRCEPRDIREALGVLLYLRGLIAFLFWTTCIIIGIILLLLLVEVLTTGRGPFWFRVEEYVNPVFIPLILYVSAPILLGLAISIILKAKELLHKVSLERLVSWAERQQEETTERLSLPDIRRLTIPILTVRARGDEAYWGLKLSRALSNLPFTFWQPRFQGALVATSIFAGVLPGFLPGLLGSIDFWPILDLTPAFFLKPLAVHAVLGTIIQFLMLCLPFLTFSQFVFGGETIFDTWFTRIDVKPVPYGGRGFSDSLTLTRSTPSNILVRSYGVSGRGLRHCLIYSDDEFLRDVERLVDEIAVESTDAR